MVAFRSIADGDGMATVYLGFARSDGDALNWIFDALNARGLKVLVSPEQFFSERDELIVNEELRLIGEADAVLMLLSPAFVASPYLVEHAVLSGFMGKLIPIIIKTSELPPELKLFKHHRLDEPALRDAQIDAIVREVLALSKANQDDTRSDGGYALSVEPPSADIDLDLSFGFSHFTDDGKKRAAAPAERSPSLTNSRMADLEAFERHRARSIDRRSAGGGGQIVRGPGNTAPSARHIGGNRVFGIFAFVLIIYLLAQRTKWIEGLNLDWIPSLGLLGFGRPKDPGQLVEVSVFAPLTTPRGSAVNVQVFAHVPEIADLERIAAIAATIDPSTSQRSRRPIREPLKVGDEITFVLSAPHAETQRAFGLGAPRSDRFVWQGRALSASFVCDVEEDAVMRIHAFDLTVFVANRPVGKLQFTIETVAARTNVPIRSGSRSDSPATDFAPRSAAANSLADISAIELAAVEARPFRNIFVSYARADIKDVRKVVRGFASTGQKYFMDTKNLQMGASWERELYRNIDLSDAVMLFWSESAKNSEMVRKEIEYAIELETKRGRPGILPFPLDGPPPPDPWEILAERHIGDPIYYGMLGK